MILYSDTVCVFQPSGWSDVAPFWDDLCEDFVKCVVCYSNTGFAEFFDWVKLLDIKEALNEDYVHCILILIMVVLIFVCHTGYILYFSVLCCCAEQR